MRIQKAILFIGIFLCTHKIFSQQAAAVDSMKANYAKANTDEEKIYWLDNLSRTLMNVSPQQADEYGKQLIAFAEETRNRGLMVKAYMSNGTRCSYFAGRTDYTIRSIEY